MDQEALTEFKEEITWWFEKECLPFLVTWAMVIAVIAAILATAGLIVVLAKHSPILLCIFVFLGATAFIAWLVNE